MSLPWGFDHELYEAWLETHHKLDERLRRLEDVCPRMVLGGPRFVCDRKSGMVLRIEYHNPALESAAAVQAFFAAVRREEEGT